MYYNSNENSPDTLGQSSTPRFSLRSIYSSLRTGMPFPYRIPPIWYPLLCTLYYVLVIPHDGVYGVATCSWFLAVLFLLGDAALFLLGTFYSVLFVPYPFCSFGSYCLMPYLSRVCSSFGRALSTVGWCSMEEALRRTLRSSCPSRPRLRLLCR